MVKQTAGRDSLGSFAPKFAELNDDVLFGEVWSREDKLSLKMRSIVTMTALISKGIVDNSLSYHLETARKNGVTKEEMAEILTQLAFYAGWPNAWAAFRIAKEVYSEDKKMRRIINMSKKLVAYFSASGVTAKLANALAEASGADLFEIEPSVPYTQKDLDWMDKTSRSSIEMKDHNSRPEISSAVENMDQYDTVFIGFPIWWYVAPTIISTFLESYDFSGKTIIPFATSGGSGMGNTESILKKCCSPSTNWKAGKRFSSADKNTIKAWLNELEVL